MNEVITINLMGIERFFLFFLKMVAEGWLIYLYLQPLKRMPR